jgi:hypothetical protein
MARLRIKVENRTDQRLEVTIKNTKPVVLTDLTLSLLGIGQQYESFIENDVPADQQVSTELLVKEVRTGSIVFELVAHALPIAPLLWDGGSLAEWCKVAKDMLLFWLGKEKKPPREISKTDLKQWDSILEPIVKDSGSQMNIVAHDGATVVQQLIINSSDANAAQNKIRRLLENMEEPVDVTYRKRVMTWYQARFDPDSRTGNKVLIESITKKPLRVIFDNNAIREEMYAQGSKFDVPWQKLAYIVDVQVQTIEEVPRVAVITNFYPNLTFNPDE